MNEMIILTAFPLWLFLWFFWPILTYWLQELFAKNVFLDILLFTLDLGQISFNPVENALPTQQLAFLATSIVFYHIVTRACAEIKIFDEKVTYVFRLFRLLDFFHLFSPFLFAAVIVELFAKKAFFFLLQWFSFYWACLRLKNWVFHSTFWAFLCISKAPFGRSLWSGHHWEDLFLQQKCLWVRKKIELKIFNPLIRGAFCKKAFFLDILVVFRLDLGQISYNLPENTFATWQHAFLATSIAFCDIMTRACAYLRLHLADHADLGIIGKIFSSSRNANFGQKWWRQKWKKGQSSSRPVTGSTGVNGLIIQWFNTVTCI